MFATLEIQDEALSHLQQIKGVGVDLQLGDIHVRMDGDAGI